MMTATSTKPEKSLQFLLDGTGCDYPKKNIPITGITGDSRCVKPGYLFIASQYPGINNIQYIGQAVKAGASAILVEATALPETDISPVPFIPVENLYQKAGVIADRFYDSPSADMSVIGITGTNGKTSVSHILATSLSELTGKTAGLSGTLGYGQFGRRLVPGPNTTPAPLILHKLLYEMRSEGTENVVLEVSSHGLEQYRVAGVHFDLALFTNLTRDHLDYHVSMKNYAAAKKRLFTDYGVKRAVINLDDKFGRELLTEIDKNIQVAGYTSRQEIFNDYSSGMICVLGTTIEEKVGNSKIAIDSTRGKAILTSKLFGQHNVANLLSAFATLLLQNYPLEQAIAALSKCESVPGRLEYYITESAVTLVIDYAHTPDALSHALKTLKPLTGHKLICVFGCGGDRDKGKRSKMGGIAASLADEVILTNDNPRHENPDMIINDIQQGIPAGTRVRVITDRKQAITKALSMATSGDIILIAGKGHENYQEIGGVKHPFSDQLVIRQLLTGAA